MKKILSLLVLSTLLLGCLCSCAAHQDGNAGTSDPAASSVQAQPEPDEGPYQPEITAEEVAYHILDEFIRGDFAAMETYLSAQSEVPLARLTAYLSEDDTLLPAYLSAFSRTEYTILSSSGSQTQAKVKIQLITPNLGSLFEEYMRQSKPQEGEDGKAVEDHDGEDGDIDAGRTIDDLIDEITDEDVDTLKTTLTITFVNEDGQWRALADDTLYDALTGHLYRQFLDQAS